MSYQPPFNITSKIIELIRMISERIGFVQRDLLNEMEPKFWTHPQGVLHPQNQAVCFLKEHAA